jgi:hypothetical protein
LISNGKDHVVTNNLAVFTPIAVLVGDSDREREAQFPLAALV